MNTLSAKEAWQGQALSKPTGSFYGVKSTGIVCITTPCPSLAALKLNASGRPTHPDLDLSTSGAAEPAIRAAYEALETSGILTAGTLVATPSPSPDGTTRWGWTLKSSEFYLPAKP